MGIGFGFRSRLQRDAGTHHAAQLSEPLAASGAAPDKRSAQEREEGQGWARFVPKFRTQLVNAGR